MIYKKNFLSNVIFRIDFPVIKELAEKLPAGLKDEILKDYPKLDPIEQVGIHIENKGGDFKAEKETKITWKFKSKYEKLFVEIDPEYLAVISQEYSNYPNFRKKIENITKKFFSIYPDIKINRLGLRYINEIIMENEKDFFNWGKYINANLVKNIDFITDKQSIRRTMQKMELACNEEIMLRFICGIFNKTYPGQVVKKEFILDYDCYTKVSFDKEKLFERLDKFNKILSDYFEKSITENFRRILNEE